MTIACSAPTAHESPVEWLGDVVERELLLICPRHPAAPMPLLRTDVMPGARYWCSVCGFRTSLFDEASQAPKSDALVELQAKEAIRAHAFLVALAYLLDAQKNPSHVDPALHVTHLATVSDWKYSQYSRSG